MSTTAPGRRLAPDELVEATAHSDIYVRQLRRTQLTLSLLALAAYGGFVGGLPLLLYLVHGLHVRTLFGVPLTLIIVVGVPFPLFLAVALLYQRRTESVESAFDDLVGEDDA